MSWFVHTHSNLFLTHSEIVDRIDSVRNVWIDFDDDDRWVSRGKKKNWSPLSCQFCSLTTNRRQQHVFCLYGQTNSSVRYSYWSIDDSDESKREILIGYPLFYSFISFFFSLIFEDVRTSRTVGSIDRNEYEHSLMTLFIHSNEVL